MDFHFIPKDEVAAIRNRIDHPILDADGHKVEFVPLVEEIAREIGGDDVAERLKSVRRDTLENGLIPIRGFFGQPGRNTLDRVTATVPKLLYQRLDEIGIDFGLLYPTGHGLLLSLFPDSELRQVTARAINIYSAEVYASYRDRIEPVATIPTVTPEEAIEELEFAVGELGLKAVVMTGVIPRQVRPDGSPANWIDSLGHESLYDYDPVWAKCAELGVVPTFHGHGNAWGSRVSSKNFVHNHVGHFAAAQEAVCRALVMGGAPRRFPELRFAFLEGGVSWAVQLYSDLLSHYAKRNKDVIRMFDPREGDPVLRGQLFAEFAEGRIAGLSDRVEKEFLRGSMASDLPQDDESLDDFVESLISDPSHLVDEFSRQFYFGCEADDPMNSLAFDAKRVPHGIQLNAVFASDIGHFDVPDMRDVLIEAWEAVDDGLMSEENFRDFSCGNLARMLTSGNPSFFDGTVVDSKAALGQIR